MKFSFPSKAVTENDLSGDTWIFSPGSSFCIWQWRSPKVIIRARILKLHSQGEWLLWESERKVTRVKLSCERFYSDAISHQRTISGTRDLCERTGSDERFCLHMNTFYLCKFIFMKENSFLYSFQSNFI